MADSCRKSDSQAPLIDDLDAPRRRSGHVLTGAATWLG